jgi:hypothetical protein
MRPNTHLPPESYLDESDLGELLSDEMNHTATDAIGSDAVVVVFCDDRGEDDKYGYEVRVGDVHERIDGGHDSVLEAIVAFYEWAEKELDEDEDED